MAKYAVGYVLALLILAVVGLALWTGGGTVFLPWQNFGGGVDRFERPMPIPFPAEPAPPREVVVRPVELAVIDSNGVRAAFSPESYCWTEGFASECADSFGGGFTVFSGSIGKPIKLEFTMNVDVTVDIEPLDPACRPITDVYTSVSTVTLDSMGLGTQQVTVLAEAPQGHANWVFQVEIEGDTGC